MKRIIMHIDANSAFLSWSASELLKKGGEDLRLCAAAVGGDKAERKGIILAKSEKAKKMGVKTGEPLFSALYKCPGLIIIPPDYDLYLKKSAEMYHLLQEYSPIVERYSIDECFLDYTGMENLMGSAKECADIIRYRMKAELGFTVNIGIGDNKLLAKMASDFEKPDKTHTLWKEEVPEKMAPLPVGDLFMCGPKSKAALESIGIHKIGDITSLPIEIIKSKLGNAMGNDIYYHSLGIDDSPVIPEGSIKAKSFSNSLTLAQDMCSISDIKDLLFPLSGKVSYRMRRENLSALCVGVRLKTCGFEVYSAQKKVPEPLFAHDDVYNEALKLIKDLWRGTPLRSLGVSLSELVPDIGDQMSMDDNDKKVKMRILCRTEDKIIKKYGDAGITRASLMKKDMGKIGKGNFTF